MITLLIISMIGLTEDQGIQVTESEDPGRFVEINVYHTSSESGYGSSINFNIGIEKDNRSLAAGAIFQEKPGRLSGGEISYRHHLRFSNKLRLKPYFQYNFLFRYNSFSSQTVQATTHTMTNELNGVRVATFEHYLGTGTHIHLFQNIFLDLSVGYGIILGSIDEKFSDTEHYTMGGRRRDFGLLTKFGIGYQIGK